MDCHGDQWPRTRAVFDRYSIASDEDLRQPVRATTEHLAAQPSRRRRSLSTRENQNRQNLGTVIKEGGP
jgi:hypothetical protein